MRTTLDVPNTSSLQRARAALLGAAVGDALGWPFEGRANALPSSTHKDLRYSAWEKKSGGRFNPHLEHIGAGQYSDDTQLILATARSLTITSQWWKYLALIELPFWTSYERGGGGATKRAASLWLVGGPPWKSNKNSDVARYFEAGGNGVAMRILPHCIHHVNDHSFTQTASDILINGVITHAHPRALVGALAYGYCCWIAMRLTGILEYGELIQRVMDDVGKWGKLPDISPYWKDWYRIATIVSPNYTELWHSAVEEMLSLLTIADDGLKGGALVSQRSTLEQLGAYDKKVNGAGTVTAAAAIFFSSRYAASPLEGLSLSATATGTDTDTTASMAGAILGAISGSDWLLRYYDETQDVGYIDHMATLLQSESKRDTPQGDIVGLRKSTLQRFVKAVANTEGTEGINRDVLPNGLHIVDIQEYAPSPSRNAKTTYWKVSTSDGPTYYIRNISHKQKPHPTNTANTDKPVNNNAGFTISTIGISLKVANIDRSRIFYEDVLGLPVTGQTTKSVRFGYALALKEGPVELFPCEAIRIFLQVTNLQTCLQKITEQGIRTRDLSEQGRIKSFECKDPDGYTIEVYERS